MTWSAWLLAAVLMGAAALGGLLVCQGCGHMTRPRRRRALSMSEHADIAIVASDWSGLSTDQQTDALAWMLEAIALQSRSVGRVALRYADAAGHAARTCPPRHYEPSTDPPQRD